MAVVETGTWTLRAGYIGDATCTRALRPVQCSMAPDETNFISMLCSASTVPTPAGKAEGENHISTLSTSGASEQNGGPTTGVADEESAREAPHFNTLWSLRAFQQSPELHMAYLRHIKCGVLRCAEEDPLMLVVPELWQERLDVLEGLFELALEEPGLTRSLYCCRPSVAWALSAGRSSAIIVDVGHSHTTTTAVLDGYALRHTVESVPVGGAAVSAQFSTLLSPVLNASNVAARYVGITHPEARQHLLEDAVGDVKRVYGAVTTSATAGAVPAPSTLLHAPDGTRLSLSTDVRCKPYEVFFRTEPDSFHIANMIVRCKSRVDREWQLHTVHHLLTGGTSHTPGFRDRVLQEAKERDSAYFRWERDNAFNVAPAVDGAWAGAAMAASSSSFGPLWIARSEWQEEGASCLYRKQFF